MKISTENLSRCIRTLKTSLEMLEKATPESIEFEIYRNAVVKGFELTLETCGKLLRKALKQYTGAPRNVDQLVFKDVFREALKHGLIVDQDTVERWFAYRENRNNTAHDYGIGFAEETLKLLPGFLTDAGSVEAAIAEKFGHD